MRGYQLKIVLGGLLACALCNRAAAQQQFTADKVIAVVGNSMVLYSDLERLTQSLIDQQKETGYTSGRDPRCEALEHLIVQKVLYNQSQIDSIKIYNERIIDQKVQDRLNDETEKFGSLAALEMYYHKPIFDIRADMKRSAQEDSYAYEMENTVKNKVTVTPGEVEKYFKRQSKDSIPVIPEQYVYAQIVRYPSAAENAKMRAQERLLELRERILKGDKFDMLARIYSEDPGSASRGGDVGTVTKDMMVEPFAKAKSQLKPGQVSGVVETEYGFHLIQMIDKTGSQYHVRHILIKPQYTQKDMEEPYDLLDSVSREIKAGNLTFEKAVEKYSEDRFSAKNGGIVSNLEQLEFYYRGMVDPSEASTKFYKENLNREDLEALQALTPGEVSNPFAAVDTHGSLLCKLVMLKEVIPTHSANLNEDYKQIEKLTLAQKQQEVFDKWLASKIEGMYIRIDKEFHDCDFQHKELLK